MRSLSQLIFVLLIIFLTLPLFAQGQGSPNVTLLANVDQYSSTGYNDIWGYTAPDGREYALLGVLNGTSIIDITDPANTTEINFISSAQSTWRDIKTYQTYAYVVNETSGGIQIIDLSDLPNSANLITSSNILSASHNIYVDEPAGILYSEGESGLAVRIISLADPENPVQISSISGQCHDIYAQDGVLVVSEGTNASFGFYDVSDPANPTLITRLNVPAGGYAHNAWMTADGNHMMTTEETGGKTVKHWDISDFTNITLVSEVLAPDGIAHNAHIKREYSYVSHYGDGMRIYDVSDPANVTEVGYYDTFPGPAGGFEGNWGAYPFLTTGKVLISDRSTGLYVVQFDGAIDADLLDPKSPVSLNAYSDYTTPTGMTLTWTDPDQFVNGDPLPSSDLSIEISRDGIMVGTVAGGTESFTDAGLVDGQSYSYTASARVISNDSTSFEARASWIAGGSKIPTAPTLVGLDGDANGITITWRNATKNIDDTPMDDLAEIRLYQDGLFVASFSQATSDSGATVTESYTPATAGNYAYTITSVDNESPENESVVSNSAFTPLSAPFSDNFTTAGVPNTTMWMTTNVDVTNRASGEVSAPFSMTLNGNPDGEDIVESLPINLAGLENNQVMMTYWYQPAGTGNDPEVQDSLQLFFKNDQNQWVVINAYPGRPFQAFQEVTVDLGTLPADRGNMFHSQFQMRFRSLGSQSTTQFFDEWFIDDLSLDLGIATGIDDAISGVINEFKLDVNFPNPFNPSTTISYQLPKQSDVSLTIVNTLGQKVRTLVDESVSAGAYEVVWNGLNDAGQQVSSGLYFYRIEAEGFTQTRKMMLLK
ncbi:MAG: choice-of-anchor B family protein [Calditrichia bacterium]